MDSTDACGPTPTMPTETISQLEREMCDKKAAYASSILKGELRRAPQRSPREQRIADVQAHIRRMISQLNEMSNQESLLHEMSDKEYDLASKATQHVNYY